jgi:hypothetical protein
MLNFTAGMKNNHLKHIPIILLAVFMCAVSIQSISALSKNLHSAVPKTFTAKKRAKSIHVPVNERTFSGESLFESETENESRAQSDGSSPVISFSQNSITPHFPAKPIAVIFSAKSLKDIQPQLYLNVCLFRI